MLVAVRFANDALPNGFVPVEQREFVAEERPLLAVVSDIKSREPVFAGTLKGVSQWLEAEGFKWVTGTKGLWTNG